MKTAQNTYYLPEDKTNTYPSLAFANAMATELLPYGIAVEAKLFMRIASSEYDVAAEFCKGILAEYTVGKLNPPLFTDWENRTCFTFDEMVIQVLGYMLQLSGNDLHDPGFMARLLDKVEFKQTQELKLATQTEAEDVFMRLVTSKVSQDRGSLKNLFAASRVFATVLESIDRIKSDESRIAVLLAIKDVRGLYASLKTLKSSASDVLRFAATKNGDLTYVKLPADVKYQSLTWKERNAILKFLNEFSFESLSEALGKNRTSWNRFFKHIHLFSQKEFLKYPIVGVAARVSLSIKDDTMPDLFKGFLKELVLDNTVEILATGNLAYRTFASRVDSAIESKSFDKIVELFQKNRTYLLRNLGHISNGITKADEGRFVAFVREALPAASVDVLFSILGIDVKAEYRIIDVKGDTVIQPANYNKVIGEIQGDVKRDLWARFGYAGKVKVDPSLRDKIVPFLSKNADLERGTKIKFDERQYIYFLAHWVEKNNRTDLDTSYVSFDDNWKSETIYFGNQANSYIKHGGDITSAPAPHGATEYGRISLSEIPDRIRYIVPIINVYCGSPFSKNKEAYAGFMFSDKAQFNINSDHVRYDLTQPADSNIPFIIDIKDQSILILDYNSRVQLGLTAHSEIDNMKKLISAVNTRNYVTMGVLADILSGDEEQVCLTIKAGGDRKMNEIEPTDLYSLFN